MFRLLMLYFVFILTVNDGKQEVTRLDEILEEQGRSSVAEFQSEEPKNYRRKRYPWVIETLGYKLDKES